MAGVSEKLYPPIINGSLPAFYEENGTACIAVPFSMNRAANQSEIGGFKLKIKTVQSNTEITTLSNNSPSIAIAEGKVTFEWTGFDPKTHKNTIGSKTITLGQYLKVQLAYVHTSGIVGYFSTVGIIKYTSKPNVYIEGLNEEHGSVNRSNYVGVFEAGDDKSERPYYYNFSLFDNLGRLVETTGWLIHNTSINNIASESLSLDYTTDSYSFNAALNMNEEYGVQYSVRTVNNLEVSSRLYSIAEVDTGFSILDVGLRAENNFDDGFISLHFYSRDLETINSSTHLSDPVSLEILRAEKTDNFVSWRLITQLYVSSYEFALTEWSFKDLTVEQGMTYQYSFREYNAAGVQSSRTYSNQVYCDFEDMFLYDGERQLKIRFNPKVSSLKITRLETKSDTIGSRYPFIFRNGVVGYKEFPISGLISYLMDDNNMFLNRKDDLNILSGVDSERINSPVDQDVDDTAIGKSWELSQSLDSVAYNIQAERRFKLKVLDWLGDGKIKLFRSPTEGNYLVRLMNISLSPEDKLGRMIHTFSSTAYEVEECNYNNFYNLGLFNFSKVVESSYEYKTIKLADIIPDDGHGNSSSFKINEEDIIGYASLELSPAGTGGTPFHVRVGGNDILVIAPGYFLGTEDGNNTNIHYPNFYYDTSLNNNETTTAGIEQIVQDAQLTYMYENKKLAVGTFKNIVDAYITTVIKTFNGKGTSFNFQDTSTTLPGGEINREEQIIKFYSVKIKEKEVKTIYQTNDNSYEDSSQNILADDEFDELLIYEIINTDNNERGHYMWSSYDNGFIACEKNTNFSLYFEEEIGSDANVPPVFDLANYINEHEHRLKSISLGDGVYAECAYQVKVIEKKVQNNVNN